MAEKCMQCDKPRDCGGLRGCCARCYEFSRRLVRNGVTTWAKLEATGEVLPSRNAPSSAGGTDET